MLRQSKYPSTGEGVNKLWYLHIAELSAGIKKNTLCMCTDMEDRSGISTLQNCEKVHVCCLSHLVCGVLLWQGELRQPLPPLWQDTAHVRACPVISSHGLCSDPAWGDLAGQALSKFKTKLSRTEASSSCKSKAFCLTWASGTDLWSPRCLNGWRAVEQLGVTDHK